MEHMIERLKAVLEDLDTCVHGDNTEWTKQEYQAMYDIVGESIERLEDINEMQK